MISNIYFAWIMQLTFANNWWCLLSRTISNFLTCF